jgi:hypothetical protein
MSSARTHVAATHARMTTGLGRAVGAELLKLRTLPAVVASALGTVAVGVMLAAALASSASPGTSAARVVTQVVPFLQIGPVLIAVLAVASEYAGRQIATTLTATPNRLLLLAGKSFAYLIVATATSIATVGAGLCAAHLTFAARDAGAATEADAEAAVGAALYLVLVGLLSLGLATLLRSLVPPLVTMLSLVLIVSPLLSAYTEHARWFPDRAGSLLYRPGTDTVLGPGSGAAVLLAWIAVTASAAIITFRARDA